MTMTNSHFFPCGREGRPPMLDTPSTQDTITTDMDDQAEAAANAFTSKARHFGKASKAKTGRLSWLPPSLVLAVAVAGSALGQDNPNDCVTLRTVEPLAMYEHPDDWAFYVIDATHAAACGDQSVVYRMAVFSAGPGSVPHLATMDALRGVPGVGLEDLLIEMGSRMQLVLHPGESYKYRPHWMTLHGAEFIRPNPSLVVYCAMFTVRDRPLDPNDPTTWDRDRCNGPNDYLENPTNWRSLADAEK